jgi:hypothetical protein
MVSCCAPGSTLDEDPWTEDARAWGRDARVVPYDILGSGLQVQDSRAWDEDEEARAWDEDEEARAF